MKDKIKDIIAMGIVVFTILSVISLIVAIIAFICNVESMGIFIGIVFVCLTCGFLLAVMYALMYGRDS